MTFPLFMHPSLPDTGLLASYLVDSLRLGPTAPFDAAIVVLLLGGGVVYA
jgi:hypothetical protein